MKKITYSFSVFLGTFAPIASADDWTGLVFYAYTLLVFAPIILIYLIFSAVMYWKRKYEMPYIALMQCVFVIIVVLPALILSFSDLHKRDQFSAFVTLGIVVLSLIALPLALHSRQWYQRLDRLKKERG